MALQDVLDAMRAAEAAAGRPEGAARLIAVSKVQPPERVEAVLQAGQRVFGENRVQEALGRWPDFQARFEGIELHLIGPLQTNKAKQAVEFFDAIHTVDRPKLAAKLADAMAATGRTPALFVQVTGHRAHGHFASGGRLISTASGLCPVSRPNLVPRS
jgi:uncharacterized pyridoxal phosphate-containing UPF0001 family protein